MTVQIQAEPVPEIWANVAKDKNTYLTDESGKILTDESGHPLTVN